MSQKVQTLQVFGGHFSHLHLPASLMATKASILAQSPPLPSPVTRVIKGSALILFLLLLIFLIQFSLLFFLSLDQSKLHIDCDDLDDSCWQVQPCRELPADGDPPLPKDSLMTKPVTKAD